MRAADLVGSAISNTFRSKLRTTLTVLAIFVGAFTLTLTNAVGAAPQGFSGPPGAVTNALTDADLDSMRATEGIRAVDPVRSVLPDYIVNGENDGNGTKYEFAINPASAVTTADLKAGKQLDSSASRLELVLPDSFVKPLGFATNKAAVGSVVQIAVTDVLGAKHSVAATVVGVSAESLLASGAGANEALITELASVQSAGIDTGAHRYSVAIARFDESLSDEAIAALQDDLKADGYQAQTVADQLGTLQTVITGIVGVLNAFAVIALIAAAFGIINTLLMSVQERTREIGLMKAMGMSGAKVYALFSLEAIVIGFLGSAIGAGVAIGLGSVLSNVLTDGLLSGLPGLHILLFEPASVAFVIGLVMLIAFLSGTLPAQRAAKANPIESLRYE